MSSARESIQQPAARPDLLQVRPGVHCQRCGYELRGLSADGRCPECGLDIWFTIQHLIDPTASRLPKLREPVGVGNAMFWLMLCALVAGAVLAGHALGVLAHLRPRAYAQLGGFTLPHDLLFVASMAGIAAMWSVFRFMPPRGNDESDIAVRRDVRLLAAGLLAFAATALVQWVLERAWTGAGLPASDFSILSGRATARIALALSAVPGFIGIDGILRTIGRRSREYRRARGARQGSRPMIAACLGVAIGNLIRLVGLSVPGGASLAALGAVLSWVSALMVLIGLLYLVVNAWWIRRALRRPPPPIDEVLAPMPGRAGDRAGPDA